MNPIKHEALSNIARQFDNAYSFPKFSVKRKLVCDLIIAAKLTSEDWDSLYRILDSRGVDYDREFIETYRPLTCQVGPAPNQMEI